MSDKKMGRPTDNPKLNKISIRISDEDKDILDKYCEKENVNKTEAISKGIKSLRPKEQEQPHRPSEMAAPLFTRDIPRMKYSITRGYLLQLKIFIVGGIILMKEKLNNESLQEQSTQGKEPNTATAVIYHVEKAARRGYIFAAVAFTTMFIIMGALLAHQININQRNNEKWIELFESYDYMSQDGEGVNNINTGTQGDVVNEPDAEQAVSICLSTTLMTL